MNNSESEGERQPEEATTGPSTLADLRFQHLTDTSANNSSQVSRKRAPVQEQHRSSIGSPTSSRSTSPAPKRQKGEKAPSCLLAEEQLVAFAKEEHDLKMKQLEEVHHLKMEILKIKRETVSLKHEVAKKNLSFTDYPEEEYTATYASL